MDTIKKPNGNSKTKRYATGNESSLDESKSRLETSKEKDNEFTEFNDIIQSEEEKEKR